MAKSLFAIVLIATAIASCNQDIRTPKRPHDLTKVCFATGGCYGPCPFLAIEVDSSLTYKFYGGAYAKKKGYFTGKISPEFWDSLNIKLEAVNYRQLDTSYEHSIDDLSTETILYYGNQRKHIYGQSASLPDSVMNVLAWLMDSYKNILLQQAPDTLQFETTYQIYPEPPPVKAH